MTDTELRVAGIEASLNALGDVQTERFIALLLRESFDYTVWQRTLWADKTIEEISAAAMAARRAQEEIEQHLQQASSKPVEDILQAIPDRQPLPGDEL